MKLEPKENVNSQDVGAKWRSATPAAAPQLAVPAPTAQLEAHSPRHGQLPRRGARADSRSGSAAVLRGVSRQRSALSGAAGTVFSGPQRSRLGTTSASKLPLVRQATWRCIKWTRPGTRNACIRANEPAVRVLPNLAIQIPNSPDQAGRCRRQAAVGSCTRCPIGDDWPIGRSCERRRVGNGQCTLPGNQPLRWWSISRWLRIKGRFPIAPAVRRSARRLPCFRQSAARYRRW